MGVAAMYLRLSLEDKNGMDESNSISSQRLMIRNFIRQDAELKEYEIKEFCDDGWSGTGMDRPGMNRLMSEVKKNRIQCIVVKDLSRFSRDYIEMGTYLNQIFPFMGIRFIALGDHYDSKVDNGSTIGLDTAFKTLLYDLYSKDVSTKVKTSFENKCANGEYVFGQVPFGYRKSRKEKHKVIVDEEEAKVVRRIFSLALKGKSSTQIAKQFCGEGVPTIMQMRRPGKDTEDGKVHAWSTQAVRNILNNRFYIGEMAYGKRVSKAVGSKRYVSVPKGEWKVLTDHHEAIITQEVFEQVSSFRPENSTKRKREKHPLTGKLYCGGCRYAMIYKPLRGKNKSRHFECWKHAMLQIPECCTFFNADVLEELVLTMINKELILRGGVAEQKESLQMFQKARIATAKEKMANMRWEQEKAQASKDALYESYAVNGMTPEEYRRRADELEEQISSLSVQMHDRQEELYRMEEEYERLEADMKQVIRYSHIEELTQGLVDTFIKRIYVYKDKRVEIEWNFRETT